MFGFTKLWDQHAARPTDTTPAADGTLERTGNGDGPGDSDTLVRPQSEEEEEEHEHRPEKQYGAEGAAPSERDGSRPLTTSHLELSQEESVSLQHSYARALRAQQEVLRTRTGALIALEKAAQLRRFARESQQQLLEYVRNQLEGKDPKFVALYNNAQTDANILDAQAMTASTMEAKLVNLEFHMQRQEQDFFKALKDSEIWNTARLSSALHREASHPGSSRSASPTLDPLLEQYYSKAGDVNLLGEEIADLDMDFCRAADRRELLADQGQAPSQAASVYEREYQERRQGLSHELSLAIEAVEQAKRECVAAGLDPARQTSNPPSSEPSAFRDDPVLPSLLPMPPRPIISPLVDEPAPETDELPASQVESQVLDWAERVANSSGEVLPLSVSQQDVAALKDFRHELDTSSYVAVRRMRRNSSRSHQRRKNSGVMEHLQAT